LIAELEKNPHKPYLNAGSPLVTMTSCGADFAAGFPKDLRRPIRDLEASLESSKKHKRVDKRALKAVQDWWVKGSEEDGTLPLRLGEAMVSTTQAIDIINGGVKVNALVSRALC
jgi:Gly-Xaa carboxypeptidase